MPNPHTFRNKHLQKTQGPYVNDCPADPSSESYPSCANCSEIEYCIPGTGRCQSVPDRPKTYPDCAKCSEAQRRACSKRTDCLLYGCIYAAVGFFLAGIMALVFGIGALAIGCGVGLFAIAAYGIRAVYHLNNGARPVQALGYCRFQYKQRS